MPHRRCLVIVIVAVLWPALPAGAQGWGRGWFEQWSGPGPFSGNDYRVTVGCRNGRFRTLWQVNPESRDAEPMKLCIDAEVGDYANELDDRPSQGHVTFGLYNALVMVVPPRTRQTFELGVGLGGAHIQGDTFDVKRTVIPLRVIVKPVRLVSQGRYSGVIQLVYTGLYFPQAIDSDDIPSGDEPFEHRYLQPRYGVQIAFDFSNVIFNR